MGKTKKSAKREQRDREAESKALRERSDRADIVRYLTLLVGWLGLLFVAPYLIYLATTGRLLFEGDLAFVAVLIVSAVVASLYYAISRLG